MSSERLLKLRGFCSLAEISYQTFKRRVCKGRITVIRTPTGRIRVLYSVVEHILRRKSEVEKVKEVRAVIYARVNPGDQRSDLERKVQYLTQYCSAKGYRVVDVLSDAANGLNAEQRGLLKLFQLRSRQTDRCSDGYHIGIGSRGLALNT